MLQNRIISTTLSTILILVSLLQLQSQAEEAISSSSTILPQGIKSIKISGTKEVSGVATVQQDQYFVISDDENDAYFTVSPDGSKARIDTVPSISDKICDAEDIEVAINPETKVQKIFILSEDQKTIYIDGGGSITLPEEFFKRCGRGAEGISVRWTPGKESGKESGWDLVAISEGGFFDATHMPAEHKTRQCEPLENEEKALEIPCPFLPKISNLESSIDNIAKQYLNGFTISNPIIARYWVSPDGNSYKLLSTHEIQTSKLLDEIDDEGLRSSDVTWFKDNLLVLLGSMPKPGTSSNKSYRHTWIKGFSPNGTELPRMTVKLETIWGGYRKYTEKGSLKVKNWEGLDVSSDGEQLVMSYDAKVDSEIVLFTPVFGDN